MDYIWMDNEVIPWADAKLHVSTECVQRGAAVFEGIRGYWSPSAEQLFIFRLDEHMDRLERSAQIIRAPLRYSKEVMRQGMLDLIRANNLKYDVWARPQVYMGEGHYGYRPEEANAGAFIPIFKEESAEWAGGHYGVSSWRRISDQTMPPRVKATANYLNGRLAHVQADVDGYDEAILLDDRGRVTEAPGGCLVFVMDGKLVTPRGTDSILESITLNTIAVIARDAGLEFVERPVDRTEMYHAEEMFECGTGAEIRPVLSVDRFTIGDGKKGPITSRLQSIYHKVVRGELEEYSHWLTPVYENA